ncbi:MAG: hypothetical protein IJX58_04125 [Clostridia bacterium]|nr:hypothetical protein [Clostridia bacterium]
MISWAESVKKSLVGEGGRYTLAEKRRIDKALKLYEKAAEAAGNRDLVKRILALREEDEEDAILTDESYADENTENQPSNDHKTENMKVSDLDSKAEKGYNYSRKKYSDTEYQDYGWARENGVISASENGKLRSLFAEAVSGQAKPPKTKVGEYMIAVGDKIDNKIAYMTGTIDNPVITRIMEINLDNETELDFERRKIYDAERRGIQPKAGQLFKFYHSTDYGYRQQWQGSNVENNRNNSKLGIIGGRSSKTTSRIKEILFDDDGNVVSETRYSYKTPAESKVYKRIAEWEKLKVYEKADAETVLSHLKPYLHGLNLSHIKAEIKHKYVKGAESLRIQQYQGFVDSKDINC